MKRALFVAAVGVVLAATGGARADVTRLEVVTSLDDVRACAPMDGGKIAVGTAGGFALVRADGTIEKVMTSLDGLPETRVHSVYAEGASLWIGTEKGPAELAISGDQVTLARAFVSPPVHAIFVGAYGRGLFKLARAASASELPSEARFVQAIGARGAVRCAGTTRGLFVAAGAGGWQKLVASELHTNDIAAIARDGDTLYVGTYDRGLAKLENGRVHAIADAPVDANVNALAIERRGPGDARLWVGTARGLTVLDPSGRTAPKRFGEGGGLPSNAVHAIAAVKGGIVLVGTEHGASVFRGDVPTLLDEKQGLPLRAVWAVGEGPGGMLLLGTSTGLYYGHLGGPWQRASMATGHLKDDWVTALFVRNDVVFVGTYNGGVSRLARGGAKGFAATHLGGGYVNPAGLFASATTLYAGTMDGLVAKDLAGAGPWREIGASPGRDVTQIVAASANLDGSGEANELWVASRRGLARFRP